MRVLLLAGTTEARELAEIAAGCTDIEMIASFAGHTRGTRMRFRARCGSAASAASTDLVVVHTDARHRRDRRRDPSLLATTCRSHALGRRARHPSTPHARLVRPPWTPTDRDNWIDAEDVADAARVVARLGRVARVARRSAGSSSAAFAGLEPVAFVVRTVQTPHPLSFRPKAVIEALGPFTVDEEAALISSHGIELLVTKNAGGDDAKLVAARAARLPVVMVQRPKLVAERSFTSAKDTLAWLASASSLAPGAP